MEFPQFNPDDYPQWDPRKDFKYNKDYAEHYHGRWNGEPRHFRPWYDDDADYNTNAKSYYDYLGRVMGFLDHFIEVLNELLARNINTKDTNTVIMTREGDWTKNVLTNDYDPIEILSAIVRISATAGNAIVANSDGLYANNHADEFDALRKLLENLKNSGAWHQDGDNIFDGHLNAGRDLATGNINVFGGTQDGNSFIRTNSGKTENDITAGI